jgi:regulatory protein
MSSGDVPPAEKLDPPGDPESVARTICLRLLDHRARTRAELAAALHKRGVPDDAAQQVLDRFAEVGLVDDSALAGDYAQAQQERGLAGRAVALKLRRRGVDEATIGQAVSTIDRSTEYSAAQRLVAHKMPSMRRLDPPVQARRLVGMLCRRGYGVAMAHEVVRDAIAGVEIPAADDLE